jgi:hypothetical protein
MLGSLFGSLAPDMGAPSGTDAGASSGGPISNALGLSDRSRNVLQAMLMSMASSNDRRNMFGSAPALLMALQQQAEKKDDKAYQRGKDDRDFKFREQEAKTAHENTNRGFDFQVWQAGAPQRVTTADGSVVELPGRVFPGAPGASQQPTQLVPQPQVTPAQPEAQAAPPMPTPRPSLLDPTPSMSAGGIPSASPAAPSPVVAADQPKPQLPPGAKVLIPGQKTVEANDTIKSFQYDMKDRESRGLPRIPFSQWVKEDAEAKRTQNIFNVGPSGEPLGNPEAGLVWKRGADGKPVFDDRGAPIAVPYQGGKAYLTQEEAAAKEKKGEQQKAQSTDIVTQDIDRVLKAGKESSLPTTGPIGGMLANIPGTAAYDTSKLLTGIKANISFDALQKMREASPTGGALGAVSDKEGELLQSVYGSLAQSQGTPQFEYNLKRLKNTLLDVVHGPGKGPAREALSSEKGTGPSREDIEAEMKRRGLK